MTKMLNDIRVYNYYDDEPLINRMDQAKNYFENKFANIKVDVDLSKLDGKLDKIDDDVQNIHTEVDLTEIKEQISESTEEIIEAIEESKPCLCHLATKEDVCHAKCAIINKIESSKDEIIKDIDEKFVDINEIIK